MYNLNQQIKSFTEQGIIISATADLHNFSYAGADRTSAELKTIASNMMRQLSKYNHINRLNAEKFYASFIIDKPRPEPNAKGLRHIKDCHDLGGHIQIFRVSDNSWHMTITPIQSDILAK